MDCPVNVIGYWLCVLWVRNKSILFIDIFRVCLFQLNPNSKAYNEGLQVGDFVEKINGNSTQDLVHHQALDLIRKANHKLLLEIRR